MHIHTYPLAKLVVVALTVSGGCASNNWRPTPGSAEDPPAVVSLLTQGSWGNPIENECVLNPHTWSFSDDLREMTLTFSRTPVLGKLVYDYRIRSISDSRIRADMVDEDRRMPSGALVVWDLEMTSEDGYRWRVANDRSLPPLLRLVRCSS